MIKVSMRLIFSAAALALATFVGSDLARADWLSDAWSEDSVRRNGNPAITIQRDAIHVVLPAPTLLQAYKEGITTERVLGDFLERYGQRCTWGRNARTSRCRGPIVREGGRADNGCSVNWAGGGVANSFLRRTLSPRLSLAGRDPIHSAVTDRHFIHEAPTEQLIEKMDDAGDPRRDLKILVSAVQSRPTISVTYASSRICIKILVSAV